MQKNGIKPVMVLMSLGLLSLHANASDAESKSSPMKKSKIVKADNETANQLKMLNQKVDVLSTKVVQLEKENKSLKRPVQRLTPTKVQVNKAVTFIPHKPHYTEEKEGRKTYQYVDKNYYDVSPDDLNKSSYFQIMNQNEPMSTAYNDLCIKNALCFSALTNIDLRTYNRKGALSIIDNQFTSSLVGLAVRPLFGQHDNNILGSINNANLFIDGYINPYVMAHMNLAYVNGSVKIKTFSPLEPDWASAYRNAAALKMDEVYGTLIIPKTPLFVRVGKQYLNFGDYKPYPITESLVQLLTQIRSGGIIAGAVMPNGLYASANFSMAEQSLQNYSFPLAPFDYKSAKERNFGVKAGYEGDLGTLHFNTNASWIHDMRDSDYLSEQAKFYSYGYAATDPILLRRFTENQVFVMKRTPGVAFHANAQYKRVGVLAEFASAVGYMNPDIPNSKIQAWGLHGNLMFDVFGYSALADLGYERGNDAQVFQTLVYGPLPIIGIPMPTQLGYSLPKQRIVGTLSAVVLPEITLSAQWVHDTDFPISFLGPNFASPGSGRSSDIGIVRVSAQL